MSGPDVLVDASATVALAVTDRMHHPMAARALRGRRLGLSGHAAFEATRC